MTEFLSALITLLIVIDPLGTAAVYTSLTVGFDVKEARKIALKACIIAFALFCVFALFGLALLEKVGITLEAFRVAGGLLLFVTGFRMLFGFHDHNALAEPENIYADRSNIAVFPLAIPLISGPGCLTAVMLLSSKAQGITQDLANWAAMLVAIIITFACLYTARTLAKYLGRDIMQIMIRVMGLLLAALAVQFVSDGVNALLAMNGISTLKHYA